MSRVSRRNFIRQITKGAAGAAAYGAGASWLARAEARAKQGRLGFRSSPPPAGVIQPSDLTPLGSFKVYDEAGGDNLFNYTRGYLTGIRRGGTLSLLMMGAIQGASVTTFDVGEMSIPSDGALTTNPATMPNAPLVRYWPYGSVFNVAVPGQDGVNKYAVISGIYHDGEKLIFTARTNYGNLGEFANIGYAVLGDGSGGVGTATQYGPWGTGFYQLTAGGLFPIPQRVVDLTGCGTHGICTNGTPNTPAGSAWGPGIVTLTPHAKESTPDPTTGPFTQTLSGIAVFNDASHPASRDGTAIDFFRTYSALANEPYPCSGRSFVPAINSWGGIPANDPSTFLDWFDAAVWIEGPSKRGVLFTGQLVETISIANGYSYDMNYGGDHPNNADNWYGSNPDCYNQYSTNWMSAGPGSGSLTHYLYIYDPAQFVEVLQSARAPYACTPNAIARWNSIYPTIPEFRYSDYQTSGFYYDDQAKRLYLARWNSYKDGCCNYLPIIDVFAVNC